MEKFNANEIPITVGTVNLSLFKHVIFRAYSNQIKKAQAKIRTYEDVTMETLS